MSFSTTVAALSAGALATGVAHQVHATFHARRAHYGWTEKVLVCESGNRIATYRRESHPEAPELFFETGLMNTSTSWLMLAKALSADHNVTIYDRAGYRRSRRTRSEPYTIGESVSDAVDVVQTLRRPDAETFLVGHSLGGYIVHRAAALLQGISGLILIDPMHPQELVISHQQREGSKSVDLALRTGPVTIGLGGGLLMDKAGILKSTDGNPHVSALRHELSAVSTWATALREWRYSYPFMLDGGAPLETLTPPVHLLAATGTIDGSPEQHDMFHGYLDSGGHGGTLQVIDGSTHLGIVSSAATAPVVTDAIRAISHARQPSPCAAACCAAAHRSTEEEDSHAIG